MEPFRCSKNLNLECRNCSNSWLKIKLKNEIKIAEVEAEHDPEVEVEQDPGAEIEQDPGAEIDQDLEVKVVVLGLDPDPVHIQDHLVHDPDLGRGQDQD